MQLPMENVEVVLSQQMVLPFIGCQQQQRSVIQRMWEKRYVFSVMTRVPIRGEVL